MEKTCLVIIFNHRYDDNIRKLRKLYEERFSRIFFLVPFYQGEDADVIPVYESSYQFTGYLIQAYQRLMECDAEYFLFAGDDCIINPFIDEKNAVSEFGLSDKELFLSGMAPLNAPGMFYWMHSRKAPEAFLSRAVEWRGELPTAEEAFGRFERFFGGADREYTDSFFAGQMKNETEPEHFRAIADFLQSNGGSREVVYPLAWGYADIFLIKRSRLFSIARLNGILSAMNLFVEIAFPTSIVLTIPRKKIQMMGDLQNYSSKVVWTRKEKEELQARFQSVEDLRQKWPPAILFMHPIKLSGLE